MFNLITRCILNHKQYNQTQLTIMRKLSSGEVATALRPFYFTVHPDLFGRFPDQRAVNEDSLKFLSAHLEALQNHRILSSTPSNLPFYVRSSRGESETKGTFQLIKVPLAQTSNIQVVIKKILETCKLSTEYIDEKLKNTKLNTNDPSYYDNPKKKASDVDDNIFDAGLSGIQFRVKKTKETESLELWLKNNILIANLRTESLLELREEVEKLKETVIQKLKLKNIIYDCGWNVEHFRGCLKSLEKLYELHTATMLNLQGRTLVFAPFTGVSLDGHIMLFTGDVQRNWLELIQKIDQQEQYLKKIPAYENALSQVLLQIKIGRRKFMPKTHASEYTGHLRKVTTTVLDYLAKLKYPKSWPANLSAYELVVESEAGPLMISPTGQIIIPSTCPGSLLIDFITSNLEEAAEKQRMYQSNKYTERDLHSQTISELQLGSLTKDDSVYPERMIICLEKLLKVKDMPFKNIFLHITNYYSVLSDGTVCIPWDWK